MWDTKNLRNETYRAADPLPKTTFAQNVKFVAILFVDVIIFCFAVIKIFIMWIFSSLFSWKRKSIVGKLALVTGGANGIGRQIALRLAQEKCNIVIADLDQEAGCRTADEITNTYGVKCKAYTVNVSNYEELELLKKTINLEMGVVNILVNNAGLLTAVSFREMGWEEVVQIFTVGTRICGQ